MRTVMQAGAVKLESAIKEVRKDICKGEARLRAEAARAVAVKMRKNISSKGKSSPGGFPARITGQLRGGIKYRKNARQYGENAALVGVGRPAYHAHLLEYGHGDGRERNKRPFFMRTFDDMQDWVKRKLSEPWID